MCSGCGAVGRVVASDTRGPGFESSHWQLLEHLLTVLEKTKNKEKEAGNGRFFKKIGDFLFLQLVTLHGNDDVGVTNSPSKFARPLR